MRERQSVSLEELADKMRRLSRDELRELMRQVPGLRKVVEAEQREQLAEAAYQVEGTEMREVLMLEE